MKNGTMVSKMTHCNMTTGELLCFTSNRLDKGLEAAGVICDSFSGVNLVVGGRWSDCMKYKTI